MWFNRKQKNRRAGRGYDVLEVKLRSSQVRATRLRFVALTFGILFGTVLSLYLTWRLGAWALDRLVYDNKSFAIQQIDIQTDGSLEKDQLRRWSGVRPGQNLLALDLARVKRDLELAPMIQSVSVERILPCTLRIRVVEREPVAQVNVPRSRAGSIDLIVFQLDADGYVIQPLARAAAASPADAADDSLPLIAGINLSELQPGRRIDSAQTQAALKLIAAFDRSAMAALVDIKRIDVFSPDVLVVRTGQGSEITFGVEDFDGQLLRWQKVHEECVRLNKRIATLNLAVTENTPLRYVDAAGAPPPAPRNAKTQRTRKKNV